LKEHSVQTATRALKDGADEELVVCGLFHDIGELLAPICHGEVGEFNCIVLYLDLKVTYT
jgi:predicted HD phosphohydrolase